ncbi:hypothetical protein [Nonomuraea guangzhouensis]|uniref:Tetracyclin repressor-like C-terminal domain-containing protein n=1 Tax=Nonomuraea guangzhouensis TaxID=1291555 RepID=A0ABW4GTY6_9ACTN|nr:hypothetical protein [Nonomuraea guangzhouensis]
MREPDQWATLIIPLLESGTDVRAGLRPADVLFAVMAFLRGVTAIAATTPQDLPAPDASASIARAIVAGLMQDEEEPRPCGRDPIGGREAPARYGAKLVSLASAPVER